MAVDIVSFSSNSMVDLSIVMLNYQRVTIKAVDEFRIQRYTELVIDECWVQEMLSLCSSRIVMVVCGFWFLVLSTSSMYINLDVICMY